jgi:lipopolysaccharide/colanic/teichoic acid biosynthesis glycosyltransferase
MAFQHSIGRSSLTAGADSQAGGMPRLFGLAALPLEEQWNALVTNLAPAIPWYDRFAAQGSVEETGYEKVKRLMDLAAGLVLLPLALVLLALCALAIRLDSPGPVFFHQMRTGKGGRRFKMYKLRTMVRNAEELKAQLMPFNELTYPDFKITNDPRVTRVGRVLRRTSLDELPQLLNVIRGDMSLVGPRPTSFSAETYNLWHTARLEVKPGLTGLWQISGRNELDFDDRLRLDIAYVRNRCLRLDLEVLLRTVGAVLNGRGAS